MSEETRVQRIDRLLEEAGSAREGLAAAIDEAFAKELELTRRQLMAQTQSAFREGFLTGRQWPKFAPWTNDIWRQSNYYNRNFGASTRDAATEARYARYNELA